MIRVNLDKVASAAKNAGLDREVYVSDDIISKEGYIVAARITSNKVVYNTLENAHGRMMRLKHGDVIAGVLGSRRAAYGYAGAVPDTLVPGDAINVLNLGGVLGRCTSFAQHIGPPFEAEVIGAVLHFPVLGERIGAPAHIGLNTIPKTATIESSAPVIAVVGTSMSAGKTVAACQIINGLTKKGYRVAAAKVTGVSLERDILGMRDYGADRVLSFNDAGLVSTNETTAPLATRRIVAELNRGRPDAIVLELGDGLLGEYGVQAVLSDQQIARHIRAVVLSAQDPVGAFGAKPLLEDRFGLHITVVTGPVTDNDIGESFIGKELGVPSANAITLPGLLTDCISMEVFKSE